jgi:hypothetical protein
MRGMSGGVYLRIMIQLRFVTAGLSLLFAVGGTLIADTFTPASFEDFYTCLQVTSTCPNNFSPTLQVIAPSATFVNTYTGSGITLSVSDSANGAPGTVGAIATSSYTNAGSTEAIGANVALGGYQDLLTISDPSLTGQDGLLFVTYSVNGSVSQSPLDAGAGTVRANVNIFAQSQTQFSYQSPDYSSSVADATTTTGIPFIFGQAFEFFFEIQAVTVPVSLDGIVQSDISSFNDTATITGLTLSDENGNPVTGATFSAASEATYTPEGVVPEPSKVSYVAFGMMMALALSLRCRRSKAILPSE